MPKSQRAIRLSSVESTLCPSDITSRVARATAILSRIAQRLDSAESDQAVGEITTEASMRKSA